MKTTERLKLQLKRKLPAFVCAVFIVLLFGLYYLGVYDVSFLKRPAAWENHIDKLYTVLFGKEEEKPSTDTDNTEPEEPERPNRRPSGGSSGGSSNSRPSRKPVTDMEFSTVSELAGQGWARTDAVYSDACQFARLDTFYAMPRAFSYSQKTYDKEELIYFEDGTESQRQVVRAVEQRPALELYMGYILYDDRGTLYILGPDGVPLRQYSDEQYIPAYTRDTEGRPLFYSPYSYTMTYPTELGEPDEEGNQEWLQTSTIRVEDKRYYYLGADGRTFVESDYDDSVDGRGLYFDYPAYYGDSDSQYNRYYKKITKVVTDLKWNTSLQKLSEWLYAKKEPDLEDEETVFPYTRAYAMRGGYAAVMQDIHWDYYNNVTENGVTENRYFEVVSNEMRVIDESGREMFSSRKNYVSNEGWSANERFVEPLSRGIDALGSYYFDHGLMRLRIQAYDRYHFTDLDMIRIVSDEDVLVYPNGERFNIPAGYRLISYSDGILLLEKDGLYGYLTNTGAWILQPEATDAKPFLEGVAVVQMEGKYGAINTDGEYVIPCKYEYVSNVSSGTLVAYSEQDGWEIYQKMAPAAS